MNMIVVMIKLPTMSCWQPDSGIFKGDGAIMLVKLLLPATKLLPVSSVNYDGNSYYYMKKYKNVTT